MTRLVSILIIAAVTFGLGPAPGHANDFRNAPGPLEYFSISQLVVPPVSNVERPGTAQPSKSLVLLNWGQNALTVKTQYFEKAAEAPTPLSAQNQAQGQLRALATSSIFDRLLGAEGELAYSSFNSKSLGGLGEVPNRMIRFGLKGEWAEYVYGAEYRSVGKDFMNLSGPSIAGDQDGGELWVQKKFGIFTARMSLSDFTNNVAGDSLLPQITRLQGGASISVAQPSWPVLSLFYLMGSQWSSNEPSDFHPQTGSFDSFGASMNYKAAQWDTTLASTYALSDITSRLGNEPTSAGGFRSNSSRVLTATPALSLGLNYRPSILPLQIGASGAYSKNKASDGYTNNDVFHLSANLTWSLGETRAGKNTLSLGTTFNRYLDHIDPAGSNRDISVWVRLKIAAF